MEKFEFTFIIIEGICIIIEIILEIVSIILSNKGEKRIMEKINNVNYNK